MFSLSISISLQSGLKQLFSGIDIPIKWMGHLLLTEDVKLSEREISFKDSIDTLSFSSHSFYYPQY